MKYLRKINPYVFEELLLLAFERRGMRVIRNSRYSGDGGLDGQVLIDGERWLIQAKRYGRTIRHISMILVNYCVVKVVVDFLFTPGVRDRPAGHGLCCGRILNWLADSVC